MTDLEKRLLVHLTQELDRMLDRCAARDYHRENCALERLTEMVHLAHQIRSLTPKGG